MQISSLVLAEQKGGTLQPVTLNTVTAAKALGGPVTVLVAGHQAATAADSASKIEGVDKVGYCLLYAFELRLDSLVKFV